MTITGRRHGHLTRYDAGTWVYADTGEPVENDPRPCPRCGRLPTQDGHDPCLGRIPGAAAACCGHGVEEGYVLHQDGRCTPLPKRA